MYRVPQVVWEFYYNNPKLDAHTAARSLGLPPRTVSRYYRYMRDSDAVPVDPEKKIISSIMAEIEEEEDDFDFEVFLKEARQQVKRADLEDPVLTQDTFTFDGDKPVAIAFISCVHLGGRYTAYEDFGNILEEMLDIPRLYIGSLGDDIEGFSSYFRDVEAVQDQLIPVNRQRKILERILEPIAAQNKLLFGCGSQHGDAWERKHSGINPIKDMYMNTFKVPFFDGIAYIRFMVGDQTYYIALGHEFPGTSQWNALQAQKRASKFRFPNADIVVQGDKHTTAYALDTSFTDEYLMGNRPSPYTWLIQSGTAKTGPDKFTIKGWSLGNFGWPVAIFYPNKHDIAVDMDLDRIRRLLDS